METKLQRSSWLVGLFGLTLLLFFNQAVQAQPIRGLANIAGKWGSGTPMITAGLRHTCALTVDGVVRCWGNNTFGELGDGTTEIRTIPVVVNGTLTDAVAISAGKFYSCGVRANG